MANSYQARIKYEESTIKEMDKTLQNSFHFGRKILLCALSLLLLGFGVRLTINNTWGLILIIVGCFIAPYGTFYTLPGAKANASIEMLKGKSFYMVFVAKKAGLEWTKPNGWLNLSFRTIRHNRANTRKELKLPR